MNTDSGLFNLVIAAKSTQRRTSSPQTQESPSLIEPRLPDIDHSLLIRTIPSLDRSPVGVNGCCEVAAASLVRETAGKRMFAAGSQRPTIARRFLENAGWIVPGAILALLPKCPACVATYAVIGAGVGFSLSAMTYLRVLLALLWALSLLYLAARRIRPVIATIFTTRKDNSWDQAERPWTDPWVRGCNRYADR